MAGDERPPDPPPPHPPATPGGAPLGYPQPPPYVPPGWGAPTGWPPPPAWGQAVPGWDPRPPYGGQVGHGRFRSMGVGELLDAIFTLYRRNFLLIAAISAVVQVPYAALQYGLFQATGFATFSRTPFGSFGSQGSTLTPAQLQQTLQNALGGILVATVVLSLVQAFVVLPLAEAATTRAVSDRYLDRPASLGSSYAAAARRLGALIVQSLILFAGAVLLIAGAFALLLGLSAAGAGVGAIFGVIILITLLVVAIIVFVRTMLAPPAIILEGLSGWRGLVRSWRLTRGLSWRLFGIRLLLLLIAAIIGGVLTALLTLAGTSLDANGQLIVTEVAGAIVSVFVGPITYIAVTLLYYDTRIRKEGFDIEMLAQSL